MRITISRRVPSRKKYSRILTDIVVFVVAIPVLIISFISIAVYYFFSKLFSFIRKKSVTAPASYNVEVPLIQSGQLRITLVEDEEDLQLTAANEEWLRHVYDEDSYFFRIRTHPLIPAIENRIGGLYVNDLQEGILLQLLTETSGNDALPDTELVLLDKDNLSVTRVETAGSYVLYNDEKDKRVIHGFNKKEEIEMLIQP